MSLIDGNTYSKGADMQSSGKDSSEVSDAEKIGAFREAEVGYEGGVQEVIANEERNLPNDEKKSEPDSLQEAVYDSVPTIQAMHQQMTSFRRMSYLVSVLLLIGFLTAAASLALAVSMATGTTFRWNQPTSSPGTVPFALKE